jgi:hypothetical protein
VQLESIFSNIPLLFIYRAPTGNSELLLNKLENINHLYEPKSESVICGDINTNYLTESYRKQCLNSLLTSSNLTSIADLPTIIQNYSSIAIGNVFIGSSKKDRIYIEPVTDDYLIIMILEFEFEFEFIHIL